SLPGEGGAGGVPGEHRALDPARELADAGEGRQLAQGGVRRLVSSRRSRQHRVEALDDLPGLPERLALEARGHHRRRRLRDGAARALKADVADDAVADVELDGDAIAAEGVVPLHRARGRGQGTEVPWPPMMVEDHLLVEVAELRHQ